MEKEQLNIYTIPTNYTESGRVLGGLVETRNLIESIIILILVGYPELRLLPVTGAVKITIMTMTLIPAVTVAITGIDSDSLFQFLWHVFLYFRRKRKISMKRIGGRKNAEEE